MQSYLFQFSIGLLAKYQLLVKFFHWCAEAQPHSSEKLLIVEIGDKNNDKEKKC